MGSGGTEHKLFCALLLKINFYKIVSAHGSHLGDNPLAEGLMTHTVAQGKGRGCSRRWCFHRRGCSDAVSAGSRLIGKAQFSWLFTEALAPGYVLFHVLGRYLVHKAGDPVCRGRAKEHALPCTDKLQMSLRPCQRNIA